MSYAPIPRGSVIGILGNGHFGRLLAQAAREMGYRAWILGPGINSPAGQVADREFDADYLDLAAIEEFAKGSDVITFGCHHIPANCLEFLGPLKTVRPSPETLLLMGNRLRERTWLQERGFPLPDFVSVRSRAELDDAIDLIGSPSILRSYRPDQDIKKCRKISAGDDLDETWSAMEGEGAILEAWVQCEQVLSVACARSVGGETRCFPVCEITYHENILVAVNAPAAIPADIAQKAQAMALQIAQSARTIGILTVQLSLLPDGGLLVNELTPTPHASGQFSMDACSSSQFQHHILAITGRPLPKIDLKEPATTVTMLGMLWRQDPAPFDALRALPHAHLHLYGKADPSPRREMGHITVLGELSPDIRESLRRLAFDQSFQPPKPPSPADIVVGRLEQRPFSPFAVILANGRSLAVDEPAALARLRGSFVHQSKEGAVTQFNPDDISAVS